MLAAAFFLPVSSCAPTAVEKTTTVQETEIIEEVELRRYNYPFQELDMDDPMSWLLLPAFFWPVAALAYRKKKPQHIGLVLSIFELLLCLLTGWVIVGLTFFNRIEFGGYLAYAGAGIYFMAALAEMVRSVRARFSKASQQTEFTE